MDWIKNLYKQPVSFIAVPAFLLTIFCHFTIFGASLSITLFYLGLIFVFIKSGKFLISENPSNLGFLIFFAALFVADILSSSRSDSLSLLFSKTNSALVFGIIHSVGL